MFVLITLFVLSVVAMAQPGGKQPIPNFIGNLKQDSLNQYGAGFGVGYWQSAQGWGIQGIRAAMLKGPHDFTKDSGIVRTEVRDSIGYDSLGVPIDTVQITVNLPKGANNRLCSYCHSIHISKEGIAVPLWNRASQAGKTFGKYVNPISLDATVYDPGTTTGGFKDNYTSFCLSCHDGSTGIFSGVSGSKVPNDMAFNESGDAHLSLSHTHPVNFDYNAVQALVPEELYPAVDPVSAVWKGYAGTNGVGGNFTGGNYTTVRLFNGTMQCSSCHNPHMASGIGTTLTSDYGRRCIACHKK